ncbi:MAG: cysteine-rich repeat protein [Bradymonadia bacterium]|jgi:cysteine-rich repeat protein
MTRRLSALITAFALSLFACGDDSSGDANEGEELADTAEVTDTTGADAGADVSDTVAADVLDTSGPDLCANGVLDEGEEDVDCGGECPDCPTSCGDGVLDDGEACDDGNRAFGDGCSASCSVEFELLSTLVPGALDGELELLLGADHRVEVAFRANLPDCESCIAGVLLLLDGEVVGCSTAEQVPRERNETFVYAPPPELGSYSLEAALAWTELSGSDGCNTLIDAVEDDPSRIVLREALVDIEVIAFPDVFTMGALTEFCVDVPGASQDDGVGLIGWECTANDNQLVVENEGAFSMVHSEKCLAVDTRGDEPYPEAVVQLPCGEDGLQAFSLHREPSGYSFTTQAGTCVEFVYRTSLGNYQLYHRECGEPASRFQTFMIVGQ